MDSGSRRKSVLNLRTDFTHARLWPMQPMEIDPEGWLRNFDDEDIDVSLALLDSFIFFSNDMTFSLLRSSLASIASYDSFENSGEMWREFLDKSILTYPTGNNPNPTDSGHMFARHARTKLGFREEQIYTPDAAVKAIESSTEPATLIIIDDIVGSGDQLIETWRRGYSLSSEGFTSLHDQFTAGKLSRVYIAAPIATEQAKTRLFEELPFIELCVAHTLSSTYSARNPNTVIVPNHLRSKLHHVIEKYAPRISCTPEEAYGHGQFGLNIAFDHSVPDLTLPLIWKATENWTPLRKRS